MDITVEIIFPSSRWTELRDHLFVRESRSSQEVTDEQMALLLAAPNIGESTGRVRLIVREILPAEAADLTRQSAVGIAPAGEFVAAALTRCRQEGWSLIEVHSHPFSHGPGTSFSGIDWNNDHAKMPAVAVLLPEGSLHATMVMGTDSLDAHYYDRQSGEILPVHRVSVSGTNHGSPWLNYIIPTSTSGHDRHSFRISDRYSRQIPLFGKTAQATLANSTVAIIGLGGLGSFAALECAHLGVGNLLLIDPDDVESTNLNRLIGATPGDIGRPKAEVYASLLRAIAPEARVEPFPSSILAAEAVEAAKQADLLLGCVDSHGARLVMNQIAVQYAIPLIDAGTGVRLDAYGNVAHAGGQIQFVLPGLGCLECRNFIDPRLAALDLAPEHIRQLEEDHGYGIQEPAPAVAFLNGIASSIQVAEAIKLLSGASGGTQHYPVATITTYDLLRQRIMRASVAPSPSCPACGPDGISALGDLSPLQAADTALTPRPTLTALSETSQSP